MIKKSQRLTKTKIADILSNYADGDSLVRCGVQFEHRGGESETKENSAGRTARLGRGLHCTATERQQAGAQAHPRGDGGTDPTH